MKDKEIMELLAPYRSLAKERTAEFYELYKSANPATNYTFDGLAWFFHIHTLHNHVEAMKIQLEEYKTKSTEKDKIEFAQRRIDDIEWTAGWLHRLQSEYETEQKISYYNRMDNLLLLGKIKDLGEEIKKRDQEIEMLKINIKSNL